MLVQLMHLVLTYIKKTAMVNQAYVDGASITYDTAVPKHIWTYATGYFLLLSLADTSGCPCNSGSTVQVPPMLAVTTTVRLVTMLML